MVESLTVALKCLQGCSNCLQSNHLWVYTALITYGVTLIGYAIVLGHHSMYIIIMCIPETDEVILVLR